MLRRVFFSLALGLAASCAYAQAPSPADVGVSKGTPDVFKLKGHDNVWTPFGSVDPSTHIFIPGTNGSIAPNDCLKWGPGITSAGMACGSGGGGGSNQLTIYTSHSGLVNNVTTPTEAWTVVQQGFYAPGDGGDATYQWNFTSYCANGTSSAPTAADGVTCILPSGQTASTAGRYLLSLSGSIDVRAVGMQPDGFDNSPIVQPLMSALGPPNGNNLGIQIDFAAAAGQNDTIYYFSQPFVVSRGTRIECKGTNVGTVGPVGLTFGPGVDGVIQESDLLAPDGGSGQSDISGCAIISLGGANPKSVIGFYGMTAASVNAPGSGFVGTSGTMTWNLAAFCSVNPVLNVTASGGQITAVTSVSNPGNCPGSIDNFTNWTPGGGLSGGNGDASFFVTPTPTPYSDNTIRNVSFPGFGGGGAGGPFTLPATCNPVGNACTFGVGDGVVVSSHDASAPIVAPGAYISASNPGAGTITLAAPFVVHPALYTLANLIDLPAAQKYAIQTTTGSNAATVTAGPRPLKPGDMLWSDAFLFGSSVMTVSSTTALPQTITVDSISLGAHAPAIVTHSSGSPGQMWVIPEGLKRRVQGSAHNNAIKYFGVGIDLICQAGTSPATGCNSSFDEKNSLGNGLVGRLARGDNTGVSTAIANVFFANTLADEVEAGTLGSSYFSEEYVSPENNGTAYGILVLCGTQNFSTFIGSYLSGQTHGPCMGADVQGNASIGVPADDNTRPSQLFIGSIYGFGTLSAGELVGPWSFAGSNNLTQTATSATPSGNVVAVPTSAAFYAGIAITDLTHPVIPAGTVVTQLRPNSVVLSNPLTGGGVQVGDQIQFTNTASSGAPCITVTPGLLGAGIDLDRDCSHFGASIKYNGYLDSWDVNGETLRLPDSNYLGYNVGGPAFGYGVQLGSFGSGGAGTERLLDSGASVPTSPGRLQGDTRLNDAPVPGGPLAWTNAQKFSTTLAGAVTGGTTTSVAVAACPSPALPAGTPVIDKTGVTIPGVSSVSRGIGTLASCASTTLTLQAAATNDGASGDTIQFLQWMPAGHVANDTAGTSWPVATVAFIANLAPCNGLGSVGLGVAYNGQDATAAGYNAPVGTTTGSTVRLVFCDGTSWTYH